MFQPGAIVENRVAGTPAEAPIAERGILFNDGAEENGAGILLEILSIWERGGKRRTSNRFSMDLFLQ